MTVQEAKQRLLFQLKNLYDEREAGNITDWVLEHITGWNKIDRVIQKDHPLSPHQKITLEKHIAELTSHKPVQYVLGEAWFAGMKFFVNENTLIPRPETEELVELVSKNELSGLPSVNSYTLLDIGTGSGCIPLSIKKKWPGLSVISCDISKDAIEVARYNSRTHQLPVDFRVMDFLDENCWSQLPEVNCIVSNPPYIPLSDKETMDNNVVMYEPWLALFVENEEPLIFYEAIAKFASSKLGSHGGIYVETHESNASRVQQLFTQHGLLQATIQKDMQGKERFVWARK